MSKRASDEVTVYTHCWTSSYWQITKHSWRSAPISKERIQETSSCIPTLMLYFKDSFLFLIENVLCSQ